MAITLLVQYLSARVRSLLLTRPHLRLERNHAWYRAYHTWPKRRYLHGFVLSGYVLSISGLLLVNIARIYASDTNTNWDFSNPNHYVLSEGMEFGSNEVRLKARNYAADQHTAALYHLDETAGAVATDDSGNGNDAELSSTAFETGIMNGAMGLDGAHAGARAEDAASLSLGSQQTVEAWTKLNAPLSPGSTEQRQTVVDKGEYKLYYDNESGKLVYEVENANYGMWSEAGGNDLNGSWDLSGKRAVSASVKMGNDLYAGLGIDTADAEVWRWNGTTWSLIGGDGLNDSWADQTFEYIYALETDGENIYAGLGSTAGDAEVWRWNGTSWAKIGGDAVNESWPISTYELVGSLDYFGGKLYAGLGSSGGDAEVWSWNGTAWTKIGGDSVNSGWATSHELVAALAQDGTHVYAGLGTSTGDAEVWRWNGTAWTKIGGDGVNSSWNTDFDTVRSLFWQGGSLYAGLGDDSGDAEVWRWNGTAWTKIGGDGVNSSWNTGYEYVMSLAHDGTNLYAGLGSGNGDGEVYQWNGSAWTKIGGDGINGSWASAAGDVIYSLTGSDGQLFAGTYDSSGPSFVYQWNGSAWTKIGGQYVNASWGYYGLASVEVLFSARGNMYAGLGSAVGSAQVWRWNGSTWSLIGGQGVNGSWEPDLFEQVTSMSTYNGNLVVGLGSTANDAEVWSWNGSTWTKIGGDSLNSGWTTNYEEVNALASYGGKLYAGLGNSSNDAEVWEWNGSTWTKIGGDSLNSGWTTSYERVSAMTIYDGALHVGLGASTGDGELWRWNGSLWTKIGGDSLNGGWDNTIEQVEAMIAYDGKLVVGLGNTADDGEVWEWNGSAWTKIGGDDLNNGWQSVTYERVRSMTVYNGDLYAGLGSTVGDGEIWRWDGSDWEKVAGNSVNGSWAATMEEVESFTVYNGQIYAGTGNTANADAVVWRWGDNAYVESTVDNFDTSWRHVAGTYDGTTVQLFINGSLNASSAKTASVPDKNTDLLIGTGYGGREQGKPQAYFHGLLDEVRLSKTARNQFTTRPYSSEPQTVELATAALVAGVSDFDDFQTSATADGTELRYRLSSDDGATWQYWDGSSWTQSNNLTEASSGTVVDDKINAFPRTFYGIKWQAIMQGDGYQRPSLQEVSIGSNSDVTAPEVNASDIQAYRSNGGSSLASNGWTNGLSPYFSWTPATDNGAGVKGYCLYLGTSSTANPVTTKGLLGNSPEYAANFCQFVVSDPSLDLSSPGLIGSPMTTSTSPYYLRIKAIDHAGNVTADVASFQFRFDNTPPSNPGYITAPSGFINTKETTLTWPSNGAQAPSDGASGLAGLQYRINNTVWYGDAHSGTGDMSDLLTNDGNYTTVSSPDFTNIDEGINTIQFRTWDQAGNVTSSYVSATLKVNTAGAPSEPQNLEATPDFNTSNAFAFSWDQPDSFVGEASNITYCYTVNTLPSSSGCTYTAPGATSLVTGPYATQPGLNTLYLVARDEANNINYSSYASTTFTANTPAPGIPSSIDIVDVSIKATSKWRLAITWEEPDDTGSGIATYRVYRSIDNASFSFVGSSSSTTYIDANLSQQTYYYYVQACDNTNNCGATSSTVSLLPTGKFTEPAAMTSNPQVSNVTTKKATITWTTDRASDSKIAMGTVSGQYGTSEVGNSDQVALHTISLDNLAAGTTYYFVAKWTDEDGNTGQSQEFTFTTSPAPVVKEVETLGVGLTTASIQFTVTGANKVNLYYGLSESFGGLKSLNTSYDESSYTFTLDGLSDGSKYFYRLSSFDAEGSEYAGNVFSFVTPPRPRIANLQFQPVAGEPTSTQLVTWSTNVPSTSIITYGLVGSVGTELQDSNPKTEHQMKISNLKDDSTYFVVAQSRDATGNLAVSDRHQFKTALDTRPPKVYDVTIESSIRGTGAEARGQVIVSWKTDEPAKSQVGYAEGSNATVFNSKTAEDGNLTTEHLVIVSDLPTSKVYSIQPISRDSAENIGTGEPQSAIIGRASENVLTIVLNTLQRVFGF